MANKGDGIIEIMRYTPQRVDQLSETEAKMALLSIIEFVRGNPSKEYGDAASTVEDSGLIDRDDLTRSGWTY